MIAAILSRFDEGLLSRLNHIWSCAFVEDRTHMA